MKLTFEDVETILRIFRDMDYAELRIEMGDLTIAASKDGGVLPLPARDGQPRRTESPAPSGDPSAEAPSTPAVGPDRVPAGLAPVRAPVTGTVYHAPKPGADPFCKVGDRVERDTTVCIVEVMKLFTSVPAGVEGVVAEILVENGALIQAGQPLFLIRPDAQ